MRQLPPPSEGASELGNKSPSPKARAIEDSIDVVGEGVLHGTARRLDVGGAVSEVLELAGGEITPRSRTQRRRPCMTRPVSRGENPASRSRRMTPTCSRLWLRPAASHAKDGATRQ